MTAHFPPKLYNHLHLLLLLFTAWLTYSSCQCVESERDALLHFKQGIRVDYCGILDDWGHTHDCCQWQGISCNNQSGHVVGLNLSSISTYYDNYLHQHCLEGTLSVSLHNLKHLKYLDLSSNNFSEALPKFIGSIGSLEHLDLSSSYFPGLIPQEIGNLSRLERLDLSSAYFQGLIPQEIGNLSSLTSLDLSGNNLRAKSLWWLSRLTLIREVYLSFTDLSMTSNTLLSSVNNLPFLRELHLDECSLSLNSPSSLSYINSSTTLSVLSLSGNNLNDTSIFEWLLNLSGLETSLTYLDVSSNSDMFGNNLQSSRRSMKRLDNLCSLQTLDLSDTNLNYKFNDIIRSFSTCPHKALVSLQLAVNQVWGSIPEGIGSFSSLRELDISQNQLNGTISQALGQLKMLERLSLIEYRERFQCIRIA